MKRYFPSYIRMPAIFFLSAGILEYMIDSGDMPAFIKYPEVFGLLMLILFVLVVFEICFAAINNLLWKMMPEEERQQKLEAAAKTPSWFTNFIKNATKAKPVAEEGDIVLNHNYDGIRELDNALPPWWLYGFYLTIIVGVIYMAKYHVFGGQTQAEEFETEMELARIEIEEYKKIAKDLVDVNTVTLMTEASDLSAGKQVFEQNCAVCHKPDGGGSIGPNLTDKYWVLGGGIKNVFKTISEGGRPSKGMEAWSKKGLKPSQIQQVASYVLSLQGTNPPDAKKAEGDLWEEEVTSEVEVEKKEEVKADTLQIQ